MRSAALGFLLSAPNLKFLETLFSISEQHNGASYVDVIERKQRMIRISTGLLYCRTRNLVF